MELNVGFREHVSPHGLEGSVSAVWIRVMPDHPVPPVEVWPDAGIDIIWQRGGEPLVAGPDTKPVPAELEPGAVLIGMRFLPGAGGPALATTMSELRNQRVALSAVGPELARRLDGGLDPYEALRRIVDALRRRVEAHPPDSLVASTVRSLNTPTASVAAAVAESSLGIRQIRRRFHQTLGYGPKTFSACGGRPRLEDIRSRFGDIVAEVVGGCTDTFEDPKPPWRPRKEAYIEHLHEAIARREPSVIVSLADKLHNARFILADLREIGRPCSSGSLQAR